MGLNGKVFYLRWNGQHQEVEGFYVHPRTRLLCHALPPNRRALKRQRLLAEEVTWLRIDVQEDTESTMESGITLISIASLLIGVNNQR